MKNKNDKRNNKCETDAVFIVEEIDDLVVVVDAILVVSPMVDDPLELSELMFAESEDVALV